ncbi:Transposase (plasmid) [Shigella dysenteriae WRSd3]|uniref:Transposase n=1 Tax=Shigella dysenteriae WRSd3 TaxID=1401327 RepID=A0A090N9C3_SHIDY|nr:Transposase [Shigella dysenteriae WRSd3]
MPSVITVMTVWRRRTITPAERALRTVCLGKKNYMFFGSDHGGDRGALLYGLIGSCRLNGIDPEAYLRHILSVLPEWPSNRVDELLPWNGASAS